MSMAAMFDTAREFTLSAADSASRLVDTRPLQISEIRLLLNSGSEREVRNGLQSVFALIASGTDTRELFADVVKNVTARDFIVRKMVYAYLAMYSDHEPELALMTINGIQKTLSSDQNPALRAMALRAMASIKVPSISTIVGMAVSEAANDLSPIVRIACCQAIGQCYALDSSMGPELLEVLSRLLNRKRDPQVLGWAMAILATSFASRMDLIHKAYRGICESLNGFDEWCQTIVLPYLVKYCRHYMSKTDPDVKRLLDACKPLLHSMSPAVVMETAAVYFYLGTPEDFDNYHVAPAVISLRQTDIVVQNLAVLVAGRPEAFRAHLSYLFITPLDGVESRISKLKMISQLSDNSRFPVIFQELQYYSQVFEDEVSLTAVMKCVASCTTKAPTRMSSVIRWLLKTVTESGKDLLVSQALMALRFLLQQQSQTNEAESRAAILYQLEKVMDGTYVPPDALATTLWLVGEYAASQPALATEALRKQIKVFANQPPAVRLQIVQLAAKIYSHYLTDSSNFDSRVPSFFEHVIYLGRYDTNYDIRDRVRTFQAILNDKEEQLATLLIQAQKPPPMFVRPEEENPFLLDSASLSIGHTLSGYMSLESWGNYGDPEDRKPDSVTPEQPEAVQSISKATVERHVPEVTSLSEQVKAVSLAEFLQSSSGEESDDEEDSEDEDESGEDDSSDVADDTEDDSDV